MKTHAFAALTLISLCAFNSAMAETFGANSNQFELEFVTIGDPGNPSDTSGNPRFVGAVDYVYQIAKYEISRDIVAKASADGGLHLTLNPMNSVLGPPQPEWPATGVSWNEAARFVNWLNSSQGHPVAYKFNTQPGDADYDPNANIELWDETDFGFDPSNRFRNSQAHYVLPSVDEWYKAAFFDPNMLDGKGGYWNFTTGSHDPPLPVASGTDPGTAVHAQPTKQGPTNVTQAGGLSPYGVMGLGGNIWEWEETEVDLLNDTPFSVRGTRGGRWLSLSGHLSVYDRDDDDLPTFELDSLGFRVASIAPISSQVDFEVFPGVGKFEQAGGSDSFLIVEEIKDGHRVRAFKAESDESTPPLLVSTWQIEPGQWYRFDAKIDHLSTTKNGGRQRQRDEIEAQPQTVVADLQSSNRIRFGSHLLSPSSETESYGFEWQFNPAGADFGDVSVNWEYTVVPINAPMPGDANGDGTVSVVDFLALADGFELEGQGWGGGDFNLDGTTDISDFLILHENFGRRVHADGVATVPEPSSHLLFAPGVFLLMTLLRKRALQF